MRPLASDLPTFQRSDVQTLGRSFTSSATASLVAGLQTSCQLFDGLFPQTIWPALDVLLCTFHRALCTVLPISSHSRRPFGTPRAARDLSSSSLRRNSKSRPNFSPLPHVNTCKLQLAQWSQLGITLLACLHWVCFATRRFSVAFAPNTCSCVAVCPTALLRLGIADSLAMCPATCAQFLSLHGRPL